MVRCAIYCRVSSDEQAEKGTIASQVDYAKRYLELHGPEMNITEHDFYLDEGVSGTIALPDRPAGSKLLLDAKKKKFDILFIYRLDRLARSVKHVLDTYDLLEKYGIALKSMTEAFDTSTPTGKFFMTLLASIAALERETILERTQGGKDRNAREGKWVSGAPPFGYRIEDKRLVIYDPEAETVRLIFQLYEDGMSTVEVAKYLNAKDVLTPTVSKGTKNKSTGKWHAGHISIILRTTAYMGSYTYLKRSKKRKDRIELEVPAIIESQKFKDIQEKIVENADVARGSKKHNYLLRGLIYCANCGRALVGSSGDSKSGRVYYRCTGTIDNGQGKICDTKQLRAYDVEKAVWDDVYELLSNPEELIKEMEEELGKNKESSEPVQSELDEVENLISEKQAARGMIARLMTKGKLTEQEAELALEDLANELGSLNARKEFLFEKIANAQSFEGNVINVRMVIDAVRDHLEELTEEEKSALVRAMVRRVEVKSVMTESGKWDSLVTSQYYFFRSMGLSNSKDAQNHTTIYSIESTWLFHAFSRKGGDRIRWR